MQKCTKRSACNFSVNCMEIIRMLPYREIECFVGKKVAATCSYIYANGNDLPFKYPRGEGYMKVIGYVMKYPNARILK